MFSLFLCFFFSFCWWHYTKWIILIVILFFYCHFLVSFWSIVKREFENIIIDQMCCKQKHRNKALWRVLFTQVPLDCINPEIFYHATFHQIPNLYTPLRKYFVIMYVRTEEKIGLERKYRVEIKCEQEKERKKVSKAGYCRLSGHFVQAIQCCHHWLEKINIFMRTWNVKTHSKRNGWAGCKGKRLQRNLKMDTMKSIVVNEIKTKNPEGNKQHCDDLNRYEQNVNWLAFLN